MITTFYPPYSFGGDGLFVEQLSRELADRGHSVDVVHCVDSFRLLQRKQPEAEPHAHAGVTVHRISSPLGRLSPIATHQTGLPLFKIRQIRRVLEGGHDVIHYHNVSLVGGPGVLKLGRGIKLYTTHEYWLVCPTHVMFRFNRAPCERPLCQACTLSYGRPPQLWRHLGLLRSGCREIDAFISPSRFGIDLHHRMGFEAPMTHIRTSFHRWTASRNRLRATSPGLRTSCSSVAWRSSRDCRRSYRCSKGVEGRLYWLPAPARTSRNSAWFNHRRLLEPIGNVPPVEYEQQYYVAQEAPVMVAGVNERALSRTRGGSKRLNVAPPYTRQKFGALLT